MGIQDEKKWTTVRDKENITFFRTLFLYRDKYFAYNKRV
jgi:hypothetical protein